jgi:hypothetical protein
MLRIQHIQPNAAPISHLYYYHPFSVIRCQRLSVPFSYPDPRSAAAARHAVVVALPPEDRACNAIDFVADDVGGKPAATAKHAAAAAATAVKKQVIASNSTASIVASGTGKCRSFNAPSHHVYMCL